MDSATTSAPRIDRRARVRGFSLVELIVASSLSVVILGAVLSAFVFLGKTGLRASAYSELDAEARRGLESFARDVRSAQGVRWIDHKTVTLLFPASSPSPSITYGFSNPTGKAGDGFFFRRDASGQTQILVRGVANDFSFQRFKLQLASEPTPAANDTETKQLQITLRADRRSAGTAVASQTAVSARHILRNKRVSN